MDLKIRHIIFIIDKENTYNIDVYHNNTIRCLKKIIAAAAKLNKKTLMLINKEKDYSDRDEETIDELFPYEKEIVFMIGRKPLPKDSHSKDSITKINIGPKCEQHPIKVPNFYCFDCSCSECNICKEECDKQKHLITDKLDFLTDSEIIVNDIFRELAIDTRKLNLEKKDDIEKLKISITKVFFPSLIEMLIKIQKEVLHYIEIYEANLTVTRTNLVENVGNLESNCAEGLNELKNKISIKDILVDEKIFLTLNEKLIQMSREQERITKDCKTYSLQCNLVSEFSSEVERIYRDIKAKLDQHLKFEIMEQLISKVKNNLISKVNKEEIINHILSNNSSVDSKMNKSPKPRRSAFPSEYVSKSNEDMKHVTGYNGMDMKFPSPAKTAKFDVFDNRDQQHTVKHITIPPTQSTTQASPMKKTQFASPASKKNESIFEEEDSAMNNSTSFTQDVPSTMQEIVPPILSSSKKRLHTDDVVIMRVFPDTNEIAVYLDSEKQIIKVPVTFNPIQGIRKFLLSSHWTSVGRKLYISGGMEEVSQKMVASKAFLCFDYDLRSVKRLPDMIVSRHSHSSYYYNYNIYVIGGYSDNKCERFDLKSNKWKGLPELNAKERQTPTLYAHGSFLYAFFGYRVGAYMDTIERINLKTLKRWEQLSYLNPNNINLKVVHSGLIPNLNDNNIVLFFGGKSHEGYKEQIRKDCFNFNFETNTFHLSDIELGEPTYFHSSQLSHLGGNIWAQFNLNENQLLRIELGESDMN